MDDTTKRILVIGAGGQVGGELVTALRQSYGADQVVAADIRDDRALRLQGHFVLLDATDAEAVKTTLLEHDIDTVYLMAAMLSATGEKMPMKAWDLNMQSLLIILDLAREGVISKVFWPSSIAVFGPTSPKLMTPQRCVMEPRTVYGISKSAGELWCQYYHEKYGVDVRSVRYPGLIGSKSQPGGGTTDYAVHIFHEALKNGHYECFLDADRTLPMMYMDEAIEASIQLMQADSASLTVHTSYNLASMSFSPKELAAQIKKVIGHFSMTYKVDYRDQLAATWPESIDDSQAQIDWGWHSSYDIARLTRDMLDGLRIVESS